MPAVSFVVSSYNQSAFLGDCVESIFRQSAHVDYEIVLVDDASTDGTDALVRSFPQSRLHYHRHEWNTGLVSTLADGFARAEGALVARIDGDDRYHPDFLASTLPLFERYPEVGLVYGDAGLMDGVGRVVSDYWEDSASRHVHKDRDYKGNEYLRLIKTNCIPAPTVIARREVWQEGFPLPNWLPPQFPATDWYLNLRAARRHDFYYLNRTLADYRLHGGNWHARPAYDHSYEEGVLHLFNQFFDEPDYAAEKRAMKNECYANLYVSLGNRYFGLEMRRDARRCYQNALTLYPRLLTDRKLVRHWAASWLEPRIYRQIKAVVRRASA